MAKAAAYEAFTKSPANLRVCRDHAALLMPEQKRMLQEAVDGQGHAFPAGRATYYRLYLTDAVAKAGDATGLAAAQAVEAYELSESINWEGTIGSASPGAADTGHHNCPCVRSGGRYRRGVGRRATSF